MPFYQFFKSAIDRLENSKTPFLNIIFSFLAIVVLRNYLEQFSDKTAASLLIEIHYALFYIAVALSLIILFHLATREKIEKIARVVLPGFIIIPLVPVVDLLLSHGHGYLMTYLLPGVHHHLWQGFIQFGAPYEGQGLTPGLRMEVALVVILSGSYFYFKTKKLFRSALFAFLVYALVFFYAALPIVVKMLADILGIPLVLSDTIMIKCYLILFLPLTQALFFLYNGKYCWAIWKDARILRNIHFQLMVVLGLFFSLNQVIGPIKIHLSWFFIPPAILFAGLFSVMINNLEDQDIDRVSNKDRPTITKDIPLETYKRLAWVFLGLALTYAWALSFLCFFTILLVIGVYYLYSAPPLRLKRAPLLSKLLISFNSLALFALGYSLPLRTLEIPSAVVLFFLVFLTAVINFIDIKDYQGDMKAGIKTLPTLLGLKKAKLMIGIFFLITYPMTYFLVKDPRLLPVMTGMGVGMFSLINRDNYSEKPVFVTYVMSLVLLIIYLWWIKETGQFLDAV